MKQDISELQFPTREERQSDIETQLRAKTREWIEQMVNEELEDALGIGRYERGEDRGGYRKGHRGRTFTTSNGKHQLRLPRGEFFEPGPEGKKEWHSELVPRYAKRSEQVEDALVKAYLSGTNTRKIKGALAPLLAGAALSKSTVNRIVARLASEFEAWSLRDLSGEDIGMLFFDGIRLKVRLGRKSESIPVLVALGVRQDGKKVLLSLKVRSSESETAWLQLTEDLCRRGVKAPVLAVIDGNGGLHTAVQETWPGIDIQRCVKHKAENLKAHAPKRLHEELDTDFCKITHADDGAEAKKAYSQFERKWGKLCPEVVTSLHEAGEELLTFYRYPQGLWKSLRTTNAIERCNEEFRRRVKTQGCLPNTDAALKLLYGLFAAGVVALRRVHGWRDVEAAVRKRREEIATKKKTDRAA